MSHSRLFFYSQYGLFCIQGKLKRYHRSDLELEDDNSSTISFDFNKDNVMEEQYPMAVKSETTRVDISQSPEKLSNESRSASLKSNKKSLIIPKLQLHSLEFNTSPSHSKKLNYVQILKKILQFDVSTNTSLEEALSQYREKRDIEFEECYSRCMKYKEREMKEKQQHLLTKNKLKETLKEHQLIIKRLKAQLLAYQILHKKDSEHTQQLSQELSKTKHELTKKLKELELENKKLTKDNIQLTEEYERLKQNIMDVKY